MWISILLIAKQTNDLMLKNHNLKPTRSIGVPEAHAGSNKSFGHSRGRVPRQDRGFRKGCG